MIKLLNSYKQTKEKLECCISEIDTAFKKTNKQDRTARLELLQMRSIYEKELYEVITIIIEIEDYLKEVNK